MVEYTKPAHRKLKIEKLRKINEAQHLEIFNIGKGYMTLFLNKLVGICVYL